MLDDARRKLVKVGGPRRKTRELKDSRRDCMEPHGAQ